MPRPRLRACHLHHAWQRIHRTDEPRHARARPRAAPPARRCAHSARCRRPSLRHAQHSRPRAQRRRAPHRQVLGQQRMPAVAWRYHRPGSRRNPAPRHPCRLRKRRAHGRHHLDPRRRRTHHERAQLLRGRHGDVSPLLHRLGQPGTALAHPAGRRLELYAAHLQRRGAPHPPRKPRHAGRRVPAPDVPALV